MPAQYIFFTHENTLQRDRLPFSLLGSGRALRCQQSRDCRNLQKRIENIGSVGRRPELRAQFAFAVFLQPIGVN